MNEGLLHSLRFKLVLLCTIGVTCINGAILSMVFAIVCMVDDMDGSGSSNQSSSACTSSSLPNTTTRYHGTFIWSSQMQSNMLIAHMYGALIALIPVGTLATSDKFKRTVTAGALLMSLTTLLVPLAAHQGFASIFALRMMFGLGISIQYPLVIAVCSKWIPKNELGRMIAFGYCGFDMGGILCNFSAGLICSTIGWQCIFYIWGALLMTWLCLWEWAFDEPEQSKFVTKTEFDYIIENRSIPSHDSTPSILQGFVLFKSLAVWAGAVHAFSTAFVFTFLYFYIPMYFKNALGIGPELNGILSGLLPACQIIGRLLCGILEDKLLNRMSPTVEVKTCCAVSFASPAISMLLLTIVDCGDYIKAVALLTTMSVGIAFTTGSYIRAAQLMSLTFSGLVAASYDLTFKVVAIFQSNIEGVMVQNKQVVDNWHILFYATSAITVCGGMFFMAFGSGEEQLSKRIVDDKDTIK